MGIKNYNLLQYTVEIYFNNISVDFKYTIGGFLFMKGQKRNTITVCFLIKTEVLEKNMKTQLLALN